MFAAVGLGLVGSIGPWAKISTFYGSSTLSGTDSDGQITMVLFVIAGILAVVGTARGATVATLVVSLLAAVVAVIDIADVRDAAGEVDASTGGLMKGSVGWGLWLVLVAAVAAFVASVAQIRSRRRAD